MKGPTFLDEYLDYLHNQLIFKMTEKHWRTDCGEFSFSRPSLGCLEPLHPRLSISPEALSPRRRQGSAERQEKLQLFLQITKYHHFYWRRIILFILLWQIVHFLLRLISCGRSINGNVLASWHTLAGVLRSFRHQTLYKWPKIQEPHPQFLYGVSPPP
jgi:hypothetical protein